MRIEISEDTYRAIAATDEDVTAFVENAVKRALAKAQQPATAIAATAEANSSPELSQAARPSPNPRSSTNELRKRGAIPIRNIRGTSLAMTPAKRGSSIPAICRFWLNEFSNFESVSVSESRPDHRSPRTVASRLPKVCAVEP